MTVGRVVFEPSDPRSCRVLMPMVPAIRSHFCVNRGHVFIQGATTCSCGAERRVIQDTRLCEFNRLNAMGKE